MTHEVECSKRQVTHVIRVVLREKTRGGRSGIWELIKEKLWTSKGGCFPLELLLKVAAGRPRERGERREKEREGERERERRREKPLQVSRI